MVRAAAHAGMAGKSPRKAAGDRPCFAGLVFVLQIKADVRRHMRMGRHVCGHGSPCGRTGLLGMAYIYCRHVLRVEDCMCANKLAVGGGSCTCVLCAVS